MKQTEASLAQANAAYAGSKDAIVLAEEKLKSAEFSLTQCTVRAPGRLFHGKVDSILEATGEGQGAVSGTLPSASKIGSPGILAVSILLNAEE